MAINYTVRKKVDKSSGEPKVLYYAAPKALQKSGVTEDQLANELAELSSLSPGDVLSVLRQLSDKIAHHLKEGRTVNIKGLGSFFPAITSQGFDTPEECTADKVWLTRICYKADSHLTSNVRHAQFSSLEFRLARAESRRKKKL